MQSTTVFVGRLLEGDSVLGGHKEVGNPLGEIHGPFVNPPPGLTWFADWDVCRRMYLWRRDGICCRGGPCRRLRVAGGVNNGADGGAVFCVCPYGWCRNREKAGFGSISPFSCRDLFVNRVTQCHAASRSRGVASGWTSQVGGWYCLVSQARLAVLR